MQFSTLLTIAASAAVVSAATVATVKKDVTALDKAATALNKQIQATDGTDQFTDLDIDSAAQDLIKAVKAATKDTKAVKSAASSSDAKSIIKTLTGTEKTAKAACKKLASDKKGYTKAGVADVVAKDVGDLSDAVDAFGTALVAKTPSSEKSDAQALLKKFTADLKVCTDAFPE